MAQALDLMHTARHVAETFKLDPILVFAMIEVESSWRPNSARLEKDYPYLFEVPAHARLHRIDHDTEAGLQRFSFGLMQIMGATARECGFSGWLPDLCKPEVGLHYGCVYFAKMCRKYAKPADQVAAYNAGSVSLLPDGTYKNKKHVNKVMAVFNSLKAPIGKP